MSQNFNHLALRLFARPTIIRNFYYNLVAVYRPFGTLLGYKNILRQLLIVRNHKTKCFIFLEGTYHFSDAMLHNSNNLGFLTLTIRLFQQCNFYNILMKCTTGILSRNKIILLHTFHFDKTKAFLMADKGTGNRLYILLCVLTSFRDCNKSFCEQTIEYRLKLRSVLRFHLQNNGKLLFLHRNIEFVIH